jgi:hypothetical protein
LFGPNSASVPIVISSSLLVQFAGIKSYLFKQSDNEKMEEDAHILAERLWGYYDKVDPGPVEPSQASDTLPSCENGEGVSVVIKNAAKGLSARWIRSTRPDPLDSNFLFISFVEVTLNAPRPVKLFRRLLAVI